MIFFKKRNCHSSKYKNVQFSDYSLINSTFPKNTNEKKSLLFIFVVVDCILF